MPRALWYKWVSVGTLWTVMCDSCEISPGVLDRATVETYYRSMVCETRINKSGRIEEKWPCLCGRAFMWYGTKFTEKDLDEN